MTAAPSVDLHRVIERTRDLLLDFDGPICSVFAGVPAPAVADRLRELLGSNDKPLPEAVAGEDDPIEVLRYASALDLDPAVWRPRCGKLSWQPSRSRYRPPRPAR